MAKGEIPQGIGGWLLLPAIGLIISPVLGVIGLLKTADNMDRLARIGGGGYGMLAMLVNGALLVFICITAVKFFKMRRDAPGYVIKLLLASFICSFFLFAIGAMTIRGGSNVTLAVFLENNFVVKGIALMIWGLYFKHSKRVAATFIH